MDSIVCSLAKALGVSFGDIVTLTGAGGKTSCLYRLGEELCESAVLLTTTTKMRYPAKDQVDKIYSAGELVTLPNPPHHGRTFLFGERLPNGKCGHVPMDKIKAVSPDYDVTVIEADGSRGLPLRGYLESEPCIPDFATLNVGIVTARGIGRPADGSWILRWPKFQQMAGVDAGEVVNEMHMARWIAHPAGMFRGSSGRKVLFWNQVETERQQEQIKKVIDCFNEEFRGHLHRIVTGSVKNSEYQLLWKRGI